MSVCRLQKVSTVPKDLAILQKVADRIRHMFSHSEKPYLFVRGQGQAPGCFISNLAG